MAPAKTLRPVQPLSQGCSSRLTRIAAPLGSSRLPDFGSVHVNILGAQFAAVA